MSNRKGFEEEVLKWITKLVPGDENKNLYINLFKSMDDKQFEQFVIDLESGKKKLAIISPNLSKNKLSLERNLDIAKELNHSFYKRIWIPPKGNLPGYLTPIKYMVLTLPITRQAQLLDKKISVAEDNNVIDNMTGQPTGKSKGSKISYPEVQVLAAFNLNSALIELLKYRGGDLKGFNAMNTSIMRTGGVSLDAIENQSGEVKSTTTLRSILTGMHLKTQI